MGLVTVKAVQNDNDEWLLDVLGVPFGGPFNGRDSEKERFSTKTKLWLEEIGKRAIIYYHGIGPDKRPAEPEIIGQEISYTKKADGVWFRVKLDQSKEICKGLWENAKKGLVGASSGAITHLVRPLTSQGRLENDGHIDIWPIGEISLTDASKGNKPINPYAVALPVLKATFKAANLDLNIETPTGVKEVKEIEIMTTQTQTKAGVTMEELRAFMIERDATKAQAEADAKEEARIKAIEAKAAKFDELEEAAAVALKAKDDNQQIKKLDRLPNPAEAEAPKPAIKGTGKYDHYTIVELGFAHELCQASNKVPSSELTRTLHAKAMHMVDTGKFQENQRLRDEKGNLVRQYHPGVDAAAIKAMRANDPMQQAAVKADEVMYSTLASYGNEWVPDLWTPQLWDLVRNEAKVLKMFEQIEVPGESLTIPTVAGKTTLYKTAQLNDQSDLTLTSTVATMTKAQTGNVTLTPLEAKAWLAVTMQFNEDSIINNIPTLVEILRLDVMEQIDEILISGDTDTTNANNSDTGNGAISTAWHLLLANGLRDYAIENSKITSVGALDAADFTAIMDDIGTNGAWALDMDKIFWLFDVPTYRKALLLGETLTADKAGDKIGTFTSGRLSHIFGSPVFNSDKYAKTDANGQIHNTIGNNTKGSVLLVRPDRWKVGFSRRFNIEVLPRSEISAITGTQHILATFRLDFKTHSGGGGVGVGINVTV